MRNVQLHYSTRGRCAPLPDSLAVSISKENIHHALYTRYHFSWSKTRHNRGPFPNTRIAHVERHRQSRDLDIGSKMIPGRYGCRTAHGVTRHPPPPDSVPNTTTCFCSSWQCRVNIGLASATAQHVCDCVVLVAGTKLFSTVRHPRHLPRLTIHPNPRGPIPLPMCLRKTLPKTQPLR